MRYAAKEQYYSQNENRNINEMSMRKLKDDINDDMKMRSRYESDSRASVRRKARVQKEADQEFLIAEKLYKTQQKKERKKKDQLNLDAIAMALKQQKEGEIRDEKTRQGIRENTPEIRELMVKFRTAMVNQTLDHQMKEQAQKAETERLDRLFEDEEMMRKNKEAQAIEEAKERAKMEEIRSYREFTKKQLEDKKRRTKLLEQAERIHDKELMDENQRKEREEWFRQEALRREKMEKHRQEIDEFVRQRELMKAAEKRREEEEKMRIDEYKKDVDERLKRAQEEQKRRDAEREKIAEGLANEILRQKKEREDYEQLLIDLAAEKELERLKQREIMEAEKIRRQHEEMMQYMRDYEEEKRKKLLLSKEEEDRLKQQMIEEQRKLAELSELEQEKNRIRVQRFRRELSKQLVEKKEMYEAQRQAELYRLKLEQDREARRQEMIEEERRKLVINHILSMGPESIKYLPKGVLREDDLNYLPQAYRDAIFKSDDFKKFL